MCPNLNWGCQDKTLYLRKDIGDHISVCPFEKISCHNKVLQNNAEGCSEMIPKSQMEHHLLK
jgi:hypothetical protein